MSTARRVNHVLPGGEIAVLLAACDVDVKGIRDLLGLLNFPIGAGFLVMAHPIVLEHMAHFYGALRRKPGIGIDHERHVRTQRLGNHGDNGLGAARPVIDIASAFGRHAELERIEAELISQF